MRNRYPLLAGAIIATAGLIWVAQPKAVPTTADPTPSDPCTLCMLSTKAPDADAVPSPLAENKTAPSPFNPSPLAPDPSPLAEKPAVTPDPMPEVKEPVMKEKHPADPTPTGPVKAKTAKPKAQRSCIDRITGQIRLLR